MKKVFVLCVAFALSLTFISNASAQQGKIGIFDEQTVLSLFPGIQQKLDTLMGKFVNDTLKPDYDYTYSQFLVKDSTFKKDSGKLTPQVRKVMLDDINNLKSKIVNWQQYQNQAMEQKQQEILAPYTQKVYDALVKIIQEQKYTYVMKSDAFVIPPPIADNLSLKVAIALKLPLPKEAQDALRNAGISTSTEAAPTKPAAKKN
ncbi:OmpH family outer membrane protein [Parasediminibacterium paludis]|uniref:OmpH family outer membrane protein n=1 Tax=Parasediminibacterium paludis TaxID=908966 RepID=A0ABV8Q2P1_9BACT